LLPNNAKPLTRYERMAREDEIKINERYNNVNNQPEATITIYY